MHLSHLSGGTDEGTYKQRDCSNFLKMRNTNRQADGLIDQQDPQQTDAILHPKWNPDISRTTNILQNGKIAIAC